MSSANFIMVIMGGLAYIIGIEGIKEWLQYTAPYRAPVLSVRVGEKWGPSLTVWGQLVGKSLIQQQMG